MSLQLQQPRSTTVLARNIRSRMLQAASLVKRSCRSLLEGHIQTEAESALRSLPSCRLNRAESAWSISVGDVDYLDKLLASTCGKLKAYPAHLLCPESEVIPATSLVELKTSSVQALEQMQSEGSRTVQKHISTTTFQKNRMMMHY